MQSRFEKFDHWIIGEGADDATGCLVHLAEPQFLCHFAAETEDIPSDVNPFHGDDGWLFWDFVWLSPGPQDSAVFITLMQEAVQAMGRRVFR
jgi:hypothetical protein